LFVVAAGAYTVCGGGGAYLWVVVASVAASVSYVLAKAAAMRVALQGKGPEPMLLLSLSLAAAHLAVAYRTSCRERRRLLVYRIDVEAVSASALFPSTFFSAKFTHFSLKNSRLHGQKGKKKEENLPSPRRDL
jgi:hypothetical protein